MPGIFKFLDIVPRKRATLTCWKDLGPGLPSLGDSETVTVSYGPRRKGQRRGLPARGRTVPVARVTIKVFERY